ncbi:MAG: serine hydrolase [Bacteroidetes bacterium]|jgi:CubicO group peptidase (beta-lactamase class C family)|nr:serine hydrolase [Bacteroidota bacterium]
MKRKVLYIVLFFIAFFLLEVTIGFTFIKEDDKVKQEEVIPISFRVSNNLSTNEKTLLVDDKMSEFMKEYGIRGAALAIAKNEKLVYAKGFGHANEETGELAEPKHLFRIASVSKLITAVAIMQMVEEDMLDVTDKVFGVDGILSDSMYLHYQDSRYEDITIEHLLTHTSGLPEKKGDPLFMPMLVARNLNIAPPVSLEQTIEYTLTNQLDSKPGRRYSYSNIGYAILGEIIKLKSEMSYEDYVKFNILQPLGINDMHIGKSFYENKFHNEVKYYQNDGIDYCMAFDGSSNRVPVYYGGNNVGILGAAGGWVASAPELMKFIVAVDGFSHKPDILSQESIDYMIASRKKLKSTIGWRGTDGYGTWWRTGTLTGSSALVMRQSNGINWLVLLNTSTGKKSRIHNALSKTMFDIMGNINEWPHFDLFTHYENDHSNSLVLKP